MFNDDDNIKALETLSKNADLLLDKYFDDFSRVELVLICKRYLMLRYLIDNLDLL